MSYITEQELLAHNYYGVTGNGNFLTGEFDFNSSTGGWKGSMALTENTDGSLTFWYWDDNQGFTTVYYERFSFVWKVISPTNGLFDTTATTSQVAISVQCSTGATGPYSYTFTSQAAHNNFFGNNNHQKCNVLPGTIQNDVVSINNWNAFRCRVFPKNPGQSSTAGMQIQLLNISHYETNNFENNLFNDGLPGDIQNSGILTLQGAIPMAPPPTPSLISLSPTSGGKLSQVQITCANMVGGYTVYFGSPSYPATTNTFSSSLISVVVPNNAPLGINQVYASNGTYNTNAIPFDVTGLTLSSAYSNEASILFPAPAAQTTPAQLVVLTIQPGNVTLTAGASQQFTAVGTYSDGSTALITDQDVIWSVTNTNGVGSIGPSNGLFVAITPGNAVTVNAVTNGQGGAVRGSATVTIAARVTSPPPLASLTITPQTPSVVVGGSVQFASSGINAVGQTTYPPVSWSVNNISGAVGTITENGLFTAVDLPNYLETSWWNGTSGSYLPTGNFGAINSTPSVVSTQVAPNLGTPPAGVNSTYYYARMVGYLVAPTTGTYTLGLDSCNGANLIVNGQGLVTSLGSTTQVLQNNGQPSASNTIALTGGQRYPLVIEYGYGNTGTAGCFLYWQPPGGSLQLVPYTNLEGDTTAGLAVTVICTAQDGSGLTTQTNVTVTAAAPPADPSPDLIALRVTPATVVLGADTTQLFTALAVNQYSDLTPTGDVTWSVVNVNGAGVIDPTSGTFTAEVAGSNVTVIATSNVDSAISGSAQVIVTPGALYRLVVTPNAGLLQLGQTIQFNAIGYDSYGNQLSLDPSQLIWTVVGGVGTISPTGLFSGSTVGIGKAVAAYQGYTGYASLTVLQVLGGVTIKTAAQQPFARVHIRNSVDPALVVDSRTRGGGLISANVLDLSDDFWWDLVGYDGPAFQMYGVYVGNVQYPAPAGITPDANYSQTLVQAVFEKYASPNFLGLVTPQTLVPIQPS